MGKYEVFFDTNAIRNPDLNTFFGNQKNLQALYEEETVDILIPKIVKQEIIAQKKRKYNDELVKIKQNQLYKYANEEIKQALFFDIDEKIEELCEDIDFEYKLIDLKDKNIVEELIELAINQEAPFEVKNDKNDKGDKGFKDAIIYFIIKQYTENHNANNKILCCTNDKRLKEALEKLNVKVFNSVIEVKSYISEKYITNEFINLINSTLKSYLSSDLNIKGQIKKENIEYMYLNFEDKDVIGVSLDGLKDDKILLLIDNDEIISYILESQKIDYLNRFDTLEELNRENKENAIISETTNEKILYKFELNENTNAKTFFTKEEKYMDSLTGMRKLMSAFGDMLQSTKKILEY